MAQYMTAGFNVSAKNLINEKSTLFQVMAWCRQATNYYLGQF